MAGSSSQYLEVPKFLSRKPKPVSRTRSKSRPRNEQPEAVISSISRPQSPPMPGAELSRKPSLTSFTRTPVATRDSANGIPKTYCYDRPDSINTPEGAHYNDSSFDLHGAVYTLEQCAVPPPELPLRQKLVGTWKLESYVAYPTATSAFQRPTYPMTKNVTGFIMYTSDGYMSAQMLIPGQTSFKRGEILDAQWVEAAKRFFAYSGPYFISNEGCGREETLRHLFQICNLPGWMGDIQIRTHRFEENGELLVLSNDEPVEINGDKRIPELKWRRARNNSDGVPPPPMPEIKITGPEGP